MTEYYLTLNKVIDEGTLEGLTEILKQECMLPFADLEFKPGFHIENRSRQWAPEEGGKPRLVNLPDQVYVLARYLPAENQFLLQTTGIERRPGNREAFGKVYQGIIELLKPVEYTRFIV